MTDNKTFQDQVSIAAETKAFLSTPVGKALMKRAEQAEIASLRRYVSIPDDDLQDKIKCCAGVLAAQNFVKWVDELIKKGEMAEQKLDYDIVMKKSGGVDC